MTANELPDPTATVDAPAPDGRRYLLIGLATIIGAIGIFQIVRVARGSGRGPALDGAGLVGDGESWETSLQHLAHAWDVRYAGVETQIGELRRDVARALAVVPPPSAPGDSAEPPPPPGPAAVGTPDPEANGATAPGPFPLAAISHSE